MFKSVYFLLLFFLSLSATAELSDEALLKDALDGSPVSLCQLSQIKPEYALHSYFLGNNQCEKSFEVTGKVFRNGQEIFKDIDFKDLGYLKDIKRIKNEAANNPEKQYLLWYLYANGYEISKLTAFTWLKVAAESKNIHALRVLGGLYYYGYIVPKDEKRAVGIFNQLIELDPNYSHFLTLFNINIKD
jgi:TPR repeat protein